MRKSKVLAKLRSGQFARICGMGHFLPFYVRYAAHFNYDGIWLDLEHRTMNDREVQAVIAACYYNDIDCMVRPQTMGRTHLYHYLEDGAAGFMIPFVSTPDIARQVVEAVKYPPLGNRGLDGAGLDADYGMEAWKPDTTYFDDANRETFILAQIETPEAVENLDAIAAVPGIDCLFIGPGDLGLRLKASGSPMTIPDVVERLAAVAREHGVAWGITSGSVEDLTRYRKLGAQIVPWGGDFALMNVLKRCSEELDGILAGQ
ncbi:MAG: aldolase/citrate lyase family protein [Chloroflexi bacterium]|nr:aldolase/citrate lyase family protein [Chloroflexota bacterium]